MRNSSLVKRLSVDNTRDLNYLPKLWAPQGAVEEHSIGIEGVLRGMLERIEKQMLALVTIIPVQNRDAENLRFPEQC